MGDSHRPPVQRHSPLGHKQRIPEPWADSWVGPPTGHPRHPGVPAPRDPASPGWSRVCTHMSESTQTFSDYQITAGEIADTKPQPPTTAGSTVTLLGTYLVQTPRSWWVSAPRGSPSFRQVPSEPLLPVSGGTSVAGGKGAEYATRNMSLWHEGYFRLIIFKKQQT